MMETGTLQELNVKPRDVVECVEWADGSSYDELNPHYIRPGKFGVAAYDTQNDEDGTGRFPLSSDSKFRIISRASDKPRVWREMTDAEKGAILLAAHEGKVIEGFFHSGWQPCDGIKYFPFAPRTAYRIHPESKRETVTLTYYKSEDIYEVSWGTNSSADHKLPDITFDLIDGKPDCASIKMDEI